MKRVISFDLIRILAITLIVVYHFNVCYNPEQVNQCYGSIGVILFFLLSGYLLRLKRGTYKNIKTYYIKRLRAIYPLLITTFLVFYVFYALSINNFLYGGNFSKIILSLSGVDGYFEFFNIETYYLIGEWFTAGIIYLYLVFPLLNFLMEEHILATSLVLSILYFLSGYIDSIFNLNLPVPPDARIFVVTYIFWIGMLLEWISKRFSFNLFTAVIPLILIILLQSRINVLKTAFPLRLVYSTAVFSFILMLTKNIHFNLDLRIVAGVFSKISFSIYLVHHQIIRFIIRVFKPIVPSPINYITLFVSSVLLIIITASLLYYLTERIVKLFSSSKRKKQRVHPKLLEGID